MSRERDAFAAGAVIGFAYAQRSWTTTVRQRRDSLEELDSGQKRAAIVVAQVVGNLCGAIFLGYEIYLNFSVLK